MAQSELYDLPDLTDAAVLDPGGGGTVLAQALAAQRMRSPFAGSSELENFALPRARAAAASVTDKPQSAAALPGAQAATSGAPAAPGGFAGLQQGYDKRMADMLAEMKQLKTDPDYSQLAQQARARGGESFDTMRAAILAGMGPQDMQHLQAPLAQHSMALQQPMKIEGGQIDAQGNVMLDPGFKRQKSIEALRDDIAALEKLKQGALTAEEKIRADALQRQMMNQMHMMGLQIQQGNLELRRQLAADKLAGGNLSTKDKAQIEDRMADDYNAITKNQREEVYQTQKIKSMLSSAELTQRRLNPVEQQSLAYMLNKFLDPNSVVREGEFDRVARAQGLVDRAALLIPKITSGAFLSPRLVKDIGELADFYNNAATTKMQGYAADYSERAQRRGLDPRNVVGSQFAPQGSNAPKPGTPAADEENYMRKPGAPR